MKALSIRQPWAWAILHAAKNIENRDWPTSFRGTFAIHAAKGMTKGEYLDFLGNYGDIRFSRPSLPRPPLNENAVLPRGAIVGVADIIGCVRKSESPWFVGDYGFVLANVRAIEPIECRGALGFWPVPSEIENEIRRQLR